VLSERLMDCWIVSFSRSITELMNIWLGIK
jgi:hypothetical protein